ncbi:hypothetical protein J3F83DRAFT_561313 [Trichoderma novae-zelandiae]
MRGTSRTQSASCPAHKSLPKSVKVSPLHMPATTPQRHAAPLHLARLKAANGNQVSVSMAKINANEDGQSYSIPCRHTAFSWGFAQGTILAVHTGPGTTEAAQRQVRGALARVRNLNFRYEVRSTGCRCRQSYGLPVARDAGRKQRL